MMRIVNIRLLAAWGFMVLALPVVSAIAQPFSIPWHTFDSGGGTSTGGGFQIDGTIGQHDAGGPMSGGNFIVTGGFWPGGESTGGTFPPDSYNAFRGVFLSGDLNSLLNSDNVDLCFQPGITLFPSEAPVTLDFIGTSPDDTPSSISVTIESSANTVGLGLTFRMWNFNTTAWQTVGTAGQTNNVDTVRTFGGTPADHVQAGTGQVRTRYEVRKVGFVFLFPWTDCVDHVFWTYG